MNSTAHAEILPLLPHLRGYARGLTGGDAQAADDLVQDTVVLALQAWDSFTPGTNLKAWLFRILHNRFHTVRSRRYVTAEIGVDDLGSRASVPATQERHADLRHFKVAFAKLSPSHREVLVLYGVHGLPYEQIAEVVGREVGSVKSRMNRARTALKALMDGEAPGEESAPRRRRGRPADPAPPRPAAAPTGLEHARVLVVEDEPLAAMDVAATLRRAGGEAVGPAHRLDRALRCAAEASFDAALLDVRLGGSQVFPVAELLEERGVPFIFLTGYQREILPERFRDRPLVRKPCPPKRLVASLSELLRPAEARVTC
jgi:RNA polymerase sigma-70 factor (ECF subfamily)